MKTESIGRRNNSVRRIGPSLLALGLIAALMPAPLHAQLPERSSLAREDGAVYLDGLLAKDLVVDITAAAPVYADLSAQRWLGNLLPGRKAVLLAVSDRAFRVRAQARQGQVAGWVGKGAVNGVSDEFVAKLEKLYERQVLVRDLIENKQVALGMTVDEVVASLGEPDNRTAKVDKEGRKDTLEFVTWERVAQPTVRYDALGRPFQSITYVRVPVGTVTIKFEDELVASIEESEGVKANGVPVRIVPPPIFLF